MSLALPAIAPAYIHASVKRRKNTWYSVKDGNWTDRSVWISNEIKRYDYPGQDIATPIFPQVGDDVYINHAVTINTTLNNGAITLNNLYVSGSLLNNSSAVRTITINGDIQATGTVDLTSTTFTLVLKGVNNYINNFVSSTTSTVTYARVGDQNIMDLSYRNLNIQGIGTKYVQANTTITGNLVIGASAKIEIGTYDFTVNGTTSMSTATFSKTGAGALVFIGNLSADNGTFTLSGNPTVETRGGVSLQVATITSGTGTWSFTTNSQTVTCSAGIKQFSGPVIVSGAITVTLTGTSAMQINDSLNGDNAGSAFVNKGLLYMNTSTAPMTTGSIDKDNFANTMGYVMNGSFTIPYTAYSSLFVSGTGTKTLSGNTTLSANLSASGSGTLDISSYNLTVTGTTIISSATLTKSSGTGNTIFIGLLTISNATWSFNTGSPATELRAGWTFNGTNTFSVLGTLTFTTNNQTVTGTTATIAANLLISGAITITNTGTLIITGTIDGNNASSTIDNRFAMDYKNATMPMVTGVLQCDAAANTWKYNLTGAQNVKGGTYRTIEFGGSGVKTLQGNVIINTTAGGSQSTTGTASVNLNGFTITTI